MLEIPVPTSPGDLIDRITILQLKSERMSEPGRLRNVRHERALLEDVARCHLSRTPDLDVLWAELLRINGALWQIEDDIRACERDGDFGPRFVEIARSVYLTNDRRSEVKRQINRLLGSSLVEEKSYSDEGRA